MPSSGRPVARLRASRASRTTERCARCRSPCPSTRGRALKAKVKLTFVKGTALKDPARLFNSSLDGNVRRAIDILEGQEVDESAFKALVRQAIALNSSGKSKPSKKAKS